ncbi:MAG: TraR/DksA C4-type zinc finger protein, partial [Bacillota bacterium]|nr:TraR/DksA C4-type zinc finger protein [Bacillota bacterium]
MQPGESQPEIERRLKQERRRLEERIRRLEEGGLSQSLRDSVGELSAYDNHSPDLGAETFERSKDLGLLDNLRLLLRRIDQALERLREGRYGLCARCGRPIDPLRLAALPYAVRCLECEEAAERERAPRPRPVEEEVLEVPFARSFREEGENN